MVEGVPVNIDRTVLDKYVIGFSTAFDKHITILKFDNVLTGNPVYSALLDGTGTLGTINFAEAFSVISSRLVAYAKNSDLKICALTHVVIGNTSCVQTSTRTMTDTSTPIKYIANTVV